MEINFDTTSLAVALAILVVCACVYLGWKLPLRLPSGPDHEEYMKGFRDEWELSYLLKPEVIQERYKLLIAIPSEHRTMREEGQLAAICRYLGEVHGVRLCY